MPEHLHPQHQAHPAAVPPPIKPWNDFDLNEETDKALAVKVIAEILMDDEWHHREDIIEEVIFETELHHKQVIKLLYNLRVHGDTRLDGDWTRLTTRWQSYTGETTQAAA